VGCGHSGTSVIKRTVANLPGLGCIPKESQLFIRKAGRKLGIAKKLAQWDAAAAAAGFTGWVEKTPKHIEKLGDILGADFAARVVLVVRDGRDVAASLSQRGVSVAEGARR
jgi:hypothetical protein